MSALFIAAPAAAGPDHVEGGDAGRLPGSAQPVGGTGPLTTISGMLTGNALFGPGDFQDMFLIFIDNPFNFSATTIGPIGDASFNTTLWLFQPTGVFGDALGLLGNDDGAVPPELGSLLLPVPTDGSPPLLLPGPYYLAISGFGSTPVSAAGEIFFFDTVSNPLEISGPDGPGGLLPITDWLGKGETGNYTIALEGVSFIPAPGTLGIIMLGLLGTRRRRGRS